MSTPLTPASAEVADGARDVTYRTLAVDGIDIFFREAGASDAPSVLLLHGWPASSHMFRDLVPKLADRVHLVAPDYPGFGFSAAPASFAHTFDNIAEPIEKSVGALGIAKLSLYVHDFGGALANRVVAGVYAT